MAKTKKRVRRKLGEAARLLDDAPGDLQYVRDLASDIARDVKRAATIISSVDSKAKDKPSPSEAKSYGEKLLDATLTLEESEALLREVGETSQAISKDIGAARDLVDRFGSKFGKLARRRR